MLRQIVRFTPLYRLILLSVAAFCVIVLTSNRPVHADNCGCYAESVACRADCDAQHRACWDSCGDPSSPGYDDCYNACQAQQSECLYPCGVQYHCCLMNCIGQPDPECGY